MTRHVIRLGLCLLSSLIVSGRQNGPLGGSYRGRVTNEITTGKAGMYLLRYGYATAAELFGPHAGRTNFTEIVMKFQRFANITLSGEIDDETLVKMSQARCGLPDFTPGSSANLRMRRKRFALAGSKWNKRDLTYKIINYTPDMPNIEVDTAIADAFKTWEDVTCLSISQSDDKDVDIEVMFAYGFHGDSGAFDGQGGTLAHGYFPGDNSIGLNGDIHFDESENWIGDDNLIKNEKRTDEVTSLYCVAVHEVGHVLGLQHSDSTDAVMWPWTRNTCSLSEDDIRGAQNLYGPPCKSTTVGPETNATSDSTTVDIGSGGTNDTTGSGAIELTTETITVDTSGSSATEFTTESITVDVSDSEQTTDDGSVTEIFTTETPFANDETTTDSETIPTESATTTSEIDEQSTMNEASISTNEANNATEITQEYTTATEASTDSATTINDIMKSTIATETTTDIATTDAIMKSTIATEATTDLATTTDTITESTIATEASTDSATTSESTTASTITEGATESTTTTESTTKLLTTTESATESTAPSESTTKPTTNVTTESTTIKISTEPSTKLTTKSTPTTNYTCDGRLDATLVASDGETYGFRGPLVYRFIDVGVDSSYPKKISDVFSVGPSAVDAAFTLVGKGKHGVSRTFLIQGRNIWSYMYSPRRGFEMERGYPRLVSQALGISVIRIDAAFSFNKKDKVNIVSDNLIWEVKLEKKGKFKTKKPKNLHREKKKEYRLLKTLGKIDAALQWTNKSVYFFVKDRYFKVKSHGKGSWAGPQSTAFWWFGCRRPGLNQTRD